MKKIITLLLVLLLVSSLFACSKPTSSDTEAETTKAANNVADTQSGAPSDEDLGWIQLDVPDGFVIVKESDQYITVINQNDKNQFVRFTRDYLMGRTLDDLSFAQISNNTSKYSKGADGYFSGFSWNVVNYQENGADCRIFFALAGDGEHYLRVTAIGLTENDFALQVIMGHLVINLEEL
jgi:hypothetical protein